VKEDVPVGILVAITPTGVLLSILLILLLAWMVIFTYLALRRTPETGIGEQETVTAQSRATATQSAAEKLSKLSPIAIQSSLAHKKLSGSEAVLEQSMH
jgi:flagellar biosynthesis/type III secretory pathway M-ring protein FliF/YscJ